MREELQLIITNFKLEIIGDLTKTKFEEALNENGYELDSDSGIILSDKYSNFALEIDLNNYELGDIIFLDNISTQISFTANNYKNGQELEELVGSVQLIIKAKEIKNGLQSIELLKDGNVLISETNRKSYKNELTVIENGTYILKTKANVTGEETINEIVITKIDTSIPTVEITQNPISGTYAKKVTFSINGIGTKYNTIQWIKDPNGNELQLSEEGNKRIALYEVTTDGIYNFTVGYKDVIGNMKILPTISHTVNNTDNSAPTITLSKSEEAIAGEIEKVNITVFAEDERAGVNKIYLVKGEEQIELTLTTVTGGKQATFSTQTNGTYYFRAEDKLGNISNNKSIIVSNIIDESKRTYLYKLGDMCSNITGDWTYTKQKNCTVNFNKDNIEMYHTDTSYYGSYVNTINKIDFSKYSKLKMIYEITQAADKDEHMAFGLRSTVGYGADKFDYYTLLNSTVLGTHISEVNINNVKGQYYAEVWREGNRNGIKIYKVWLE